MRLKEINSLVELFFKKYEEKFSNDFEKSNELFLTSLKNKNLHNNLSGPYTYSWGNIYTKINALSDYLKKIISKGDRCILLSENRPEWLISDIAIMNSGGITVPLFTTYSENDYEYIIKDSQPKICIVSNYEQFKKIKNFIIQNTIIISIDEFDKNIEFFEDIFLKAQTSFNAQVKSIVPYNTS